MLTSSFFGFTKMERMYMSSLLWKYLVLMFLHNALCSSSSSPSNTSLCSPDQSFALLNFKNSFRINNNSFYNNCYRVVSYPKTESWKEGSDCCSWDGVACDRLTGHVIGLDLSCSSLSGTLYDNSTLFHLNHLRELNLAYNFLLDSNISSKFGHFTKLTQLNLSFSGFIGPVPPEISYLSNLVSLDLSVNIFNLRLDQHSFDRLSQNLTKLKYLDLTGVNMSLVAAGSLVNLSSSLISLTLISNKLQGKFPNDLFHFPFLEQLSLSGINGPLIGHLPKSNWSSPLKILDFSETLLYGDASGDRMYLPDAIGDLIHLNVLKLTSCFLKGPVPKSLFNLTRLTYVDLTETGLSGQIPASVSNLDKLTDLYLARNEFSGQLPPSIFNLTQLSHIDLSSNQLWGNFPSQVRGLPYLNKLSLQNNSLSGRIPSWLLALPSLQTLELSNNKFTGPIDPIQRPGPVQFVSLEDNEIHGSIPDSLFELVNLTTLRLSSNNLSGIVNSKLFSKLINLWFIDLSRNRLLSLRSCSNCNFTLPNLSHFYFSSCSITRFPSFLKNSRNLRILSLSDNRISGRISLEESGWQSLFNLYLSDNFLTSVAQISSKELRTVDLHSNFLTSVGQISSKELINLDLHSNFLTSVGQISSKELGTLDLGSNLLQGPLPAMVPNASVHFFSVSHNNLTGEITSSICNMSSITYLVLANNNFSGKIPECLGNYEELTVLDLRMNNFHGSIPQIFANGSSLVTIDLNGNQLEGPLPTSLANCSSLEVLNLGNNMINDKFPHWLATLPELQVLILRSNSFHGYIVNSKTKSPFPKLRILDVAHNGFSGLLPTKLFNSFISMMHGDNNSAAMKYMGGPYYQDSVVLTWKGSDMLIERILTVLTVIDLSSNQFEGKIPEVVGKLSSLKLLNLSHNSFTGQIPSSLRNLTQLESLDLSSNQLTGEIPMQLTSLTFLSVLNLSYNQLVGSIPRGNQFDTFQSNSYLGNLGLCGPPLLSKKCVNDEAPEPVPTEEESTWSWFDWKVIMMGYGSGVVIGLSIGYMVFSTEKPYWFVKLFDRDRPTKGRRISRSHRRRNH